MNDYTELFSYKDNRFVLVMQGTYTSTNFLWSRVNKKNGDTGFITILK